MKTQHGEIEMELVGNWMELAYYYQGSDGNYWSQQNGRWTNQGKKMRNLRGITLDKKNICSLPELTE